MPDEDLVPESLSDADSTWLRREAMRKRRRDPGDNFNGRCRCGVLISEPSAGCEWHESRAAAARAEAGRLRRESDREQAELPLEARLSMSTIEGLAVGSGLRQQAAAIEAAIPEPDLVDLVAQAIHAAFRTPDSELYRGNLWATLAQAAIEEVWKHDG